MMTPKPVLLVGSGSAGVPTLLPVLELNTDAIESTQIALATAGFGFGFNEITFDRLRAHNNNVDGLVTSVGNLTSIAFGYGFNGATFDRLRSAGNNSDAVATEATGQQTVNAQLFGFNGTTFDRIRVANVYHTVIATAAGSTAVWTPSAGTKFRLMGYTIDVAATAAATGPLTIKLEDGATVIKNHIVNVIQTQTANISGGDSHMGADLGQGQLSAADDNVLNINLSEACGSGGVAINVWGTEET